MTEPKFSTEVPAGYKIDYYEKPWGRGTRRWYEIDGVRCVSVTEALGIIDDGKSGGMAWSAARIWLKGVCHLATTQERNLQWDNPQWIEDTLKAQKLLHTDVWGAKTNLGSTIHACLEALCANEYPALSTFSEDEQPYAKAVMEWWADHDPKVVATEMLVGSRLHGACGRFDLLYRDADDKLVLADLKTAAQVRPSFAIQTAAYAGFYAECGYGDIDAQEVIHVQPDGAYTVVPCTAPYEAFLAILDARNAFHAVKDEMKKAA